MFQKKLISFLLSSLLLLSINPATMCSQNNNIHVPTETYDTVINEITTTEGNDSQDKNTKQKTKTVTSEKTSKAKIFCAGIATAVAVGIVIDYIMFKLNPTLYVDINFTNAVLTLKKLNDNKQEIDNATLSQLQNNVAQLKQNHSFQEITQDIPKTLNHIIENTLISNIVSFDNSYSNLWASRFNIGNPKVIVTLKNILP